MKPVPLAIGCTHPVTVTSFPSLTVIFDLVDCSVDCAVSPTAHVAAKATADTMSFMLSVLLSRRDATIVPSTPAMGGRASAVSRLLHLEPIGSQWRFADAHV